MTGPKLNRHQMQFYSSFTLISALSAAKKSHLRSLFIVVWSVSLTINLIRLSYLKDKTNKLLKRQKNLTDK